MQIVYEQNNSSLNKSSIMFSTIYAKVLHIWLHVVNVKKKSERAISKVFENSKKAA